MKPNSEVVRSFDPKFFKWSRGKEEHGAKMEMRVRIYPSGLIVLTTRAAQKIKEHTSATDGGFYRVEIGVAPKAIAFRPLPPEEEGYRFRQYKQGGLVASCRKLVKTLEWDLPLVAIAAWDEKNKMLVGKL